MAHELLEALAYDDSTDFEQKHGKCYSSEGAVRGRIVNHGCANNKCTPPFLVMFIFLAGTAYASLLELNKIYPLEQQDEIGILNVKDVITVPNPLPDAFYFIVSNAVIFIGSVVVILLSTWPLVSEWSFCYRAVGLFVVGAMFISYALIVKKIVPKFSVTIGFRNISSFWLVWLYDLLLIFSIVIIQQIVSIFFKLSNVTEDNWKPSNNKGKHVSLYLQ
uniref:PGG domain-containing protein n=1 Tax=Davidia involucrata TaxID=16924 RepID=A0A5B7CBU2_DAVIN